MSQAGIINTSSGPVPPTVPTQFTTDTGNIAIPAANNLNVFSRDTTSNNNNGIQTTADPNLSDDLYVQLTNRTQDIIQTTDATLTPITTFALATTGTYAFNFDVAAYNITDALGAAYKVFVGIVSDGVTATKLNLEDKIVNEQAGMAACNVSVTTAGNSVVLNVTGLGTPDKTIRWNAVGSYTFIGSV